MKRKKENEIISEVETHKSKVLKHKIDQTIFDDGLTTTRSCSYTEEVLQKMFNEERVITLQNFLELLCQNYPTLSIKYQNYLSNTYDEELKATFGTTENLLHNLIIVLPFEELQSRESKHSREKLIFGNHRTKLPEDEYRINFECTMPITDLILKAISSLLVTAPKPQDGEARSKITRSHSFPSVSSKALLTTSTNSSNNSLRWQNILTRGFRYQRQPFRHQIGID
jgi:hypothetical protein